MNETLRIQQLLKNSWDGRMWHGTTVKEVLNGIDHEKAFRRPPAGSHNIYELVMHMHCWRNFVLQHLLGNADYKVVINSTVDWPTGYNTDKASWKEGLTLLEKSQHDLVAAFDGFEDSKLDEAMHTRKFSWYDFIHGMIHHDIYHSAQIAILKK
jgi:hypothetical protein